MLNRICAARMQPTRYMLDHAGHHASHTLSHPTTYRPRKSYSSLISSAMNGIDHEPGSDLSGVRMFDVSSIEHVDLLYIETLTFETISNIMPNTAQN